MEATGDTLVGATVAFEAIRTRKGVITSTLYTRTGSGSGPNR